MEKKDTITPQQFKNLQSKAHIKSVELAKILDKSRSVIAAYRRGQIKVPPAIAERMRELAKEGRNVNTRDNASVEGHVAQWLKAYSSHFMGEEYTLSAAPKYNQMSVDVTQDLDEELYLMTGAPTSWWTNPRYGN